MLKVLIVDDSEMIGDLFAEYLDEVGFKVVGVARTVSDAVKMAKLHKPHVAIIDYHIGNHLGTEIIAQLPASLRPAILYISGKPLQDILVKSDGEGFIQKPVSLSNLALALPAVWDIKSTGGTRDQVIPRGFRSLNIDQTARQFGMGDHA